MPGNQKRSVDSDKRSEGKRNAHDWISSPPPNHGHRLAIPRIFPEPCIQSRRNSLYGVSKCGVFVLVAGIGYSVLRDSSTTPTTELRCKAVGSVGSGARDNKEAVSCRIEVSLKMKLTRSRMGKYLLAGIELFSISCRCGISHIDTRSVRLESLS
jgi:hypothetical protein